MDNFYEIVRPPKTDVTVDKGTDLMEQMLLNQYDRSDNLKEYFGAFIAEIDILFEETEKVYLSRFIENATGSSLDIIGVILDETRGINLPTQFFGFVGAPNAAGFADEATPEDGGIFRGEDQSATSNYVLSDIQYRRVLLAKAILVTREECSINNAYYVISTLLGRTPQTMKIYTSAVPGLAVPLSDRQGRLELSASDTSLSDVSLISYFSKYLFPMGVNFTIVRI